MGPSAPNNSGNVPDLRVIMYFDVVCPFAFIASERIDELAKRTGAKIKWVPVLLGGLYDLTNAVQGKAGSASNIPMAAQKKVIQSADFQREINRYQLPLKFHHQHPLRSVDAGRLLCSFPPSHRRHLAHAIFRAYWYDGKNINDRTVLLEIARSAVAAGRSKARPDSGLPEDIDESVFSNTQWADDLRGNTNEALSRGAFGVPSFWIEARQKLLWGQRLFLFSHQVLRLKFICSSSIEMISVRTGQPLDKIRDLKLLQPRCLRTTPSSGSARRLTFWFDFSSPWAYLGWTQLARIGREAPGLEIILKPFLLGALFRTIGTPMMPMLTMPEVKRKYVLQDQRDWTKYWNAVNAQESPPDEPVELNWPDTFPIRSPTALRVAILEPNTVPAVYYAAWRDKKGISDNEVLADVLLAAGFDGEKLVRDATTGAKSQTAKEILRANTEEAVTLGICGAPTFQVEKTLIWGGDKINVVQDLLLGWDVTSNLKAASPSLTQSDHHL
ncbi:hypothetical protein P7C70_g5596, partial [Phenoliferia sp. Uapishka_3]